jgi:hypothetical protein
MATHDLTNGHAGRPANAIGKAMPIRERITIPLAKQVASDVLNVLNLKAGWLVKNVHLIMVTPTAGTAVAAHVGVANSAVTGYDADGFDAAVSLKGAAGTRTCGISGTDAYIVAGGFYAPVDTTLDFTLSTVTAASGDIVVDVIAEVIDLNG